MTIVKSTCHFLAIQDKRPRNLAFHTSEPPNLGTFVLARRKVASRFRNFGCNSLIFLMFSMQETVKMIVKYNF